MTINGEDEIMSRTKNLLLLLTNYLGFAKEEPNITRKLHEDQGLQISSVVLRCLSCESRVSNSGRPITSGITVTKKSVKIN